MLSVFALTRMLSATWPAAICSATRSALEWKLILSATRLPRSPPVPLISTISPGNRFVTSRARRSVLNKPDGDEIRVSAVSETTSTLASSSRMITSSPLRLMMSPLTFASSPCVKFTLSVMVVLGSSRVKDAPTSGPLPDLEGETSSTLGPAKSWIMTKRSWTS